MMKYLFMHFKILSVLLLYIMLWFVKFYKSVKNLRDIKRKEKKARIVLGF